MSEPACSSALTQTHQAHVLRLLPCCEEPGPLPWATGHHEWHSARGVSPRKVQGSRFVWLPQSTFPLLAPEPCLLVTLPAPHPGPRLPTPWGSTRPCRLPEPAVGSQAWSLCGQNAVGHSPRGRRVSLDAAGSQTPRSGGSRRQGSVGALTAGLILGPPLLGWTNDPSLGQLPWEEGMGSTPSRGS